MIKMPSRSVCLALALMCCGSGAAMLLWDESPPDSGTMQYYMGILILPGTHLLSLYLTIGAVWVRAHRKGSRVRFSEYVLTLAILAIWTIMVASIVRSGLTKRVSRRVGMDRETQQRVLLAAPDRVRQRLVAEEPKRRALPRVNELPIGFFPDSRDSWSKTRSTTKNTPATPQPGAGGNDTNGGTGRSTGCPVSSFNGWRMAIRPYRSIEP